MSWYTSQTCWKWKYIHSPSWIYYSQCQMYFIANIHIGFFLSFISPLLWGIVVVTSSMIYLISEGGKEILIWCGNNFSFVSKNHLLIYKIQTKLLDVQEPLLGSQAQTVPCTNLRSAVFILECTALRVAFIFLIFFLLYSDFIDLSSA